MGLAVPVEDRGLEEEASAPPTLGEPGLGAHSRVLVRHSRKGSKEGWWRAGPVGRTDVHPGCHFLGEMLTSQA